MDHIWPSKVVKQFQSVPFPVDTDFTVAPILTILRYGDSAESVGYEVSFDGRPAPGKISYASAREEADILVRKRLRDLRPACLLPTLHAASVFGTRLCAYHAEGGRIFPPHIKTDTNLITDTAPADRWDCDILEERGANRLKQIFAAIKAGCERR
ncbi:hypothetical protein A0H81_13591, partial [Grifola frondosa]